MNLWVQDLVGEESEKHLRHFRASQPPTIIDKRYPAHGPARYRISKGDSAAGASPWLSTWIYVDPHAIAHTRTPRTGLHTLQPEHAALYLQLDEFKEHFVVSEARLLFQEVSDFCKGPLPVSPVLQENA